MLNIHLSVGKKPSIFTSTSVNNCSLYGGGLYQFHPVVSDFSVLVSRFLIHKEEWSLLGTETGRFGCYLRGSSAKVSEACYKLHRLMLSAI